MSKSVSQVMSYTFYNTHQYISFGFCKNGIFFLNIFILNMGVLPMDKVELLKIILTVLKS